MADGTVYAAPVAARVGLCLRDGEKPGTIFSGEVSASAKLWIEAGSECHARASVPQITSRAIALRHRA